jgi:hypothetical protein
MQGLTLLAQPPRPPSGRHGRKLLAGRSRPAGQQRSRQLASKTDPSGTWLTRGPRTEQSYGLSGAFGGFGEQSVAVGDSGSEVVELAVARAGASVTEPSRITTTSRSRTAERAARRAMVARAVINIAGSHIGQPPASRGPSHARTRRFKGCTRLNVSRRRPATPATRRAAAARAGIRAPRRARARRTPGTGDGPGSGR